MQNQLPPQDDGLCQPVRWMQVTVVTTGTWRAVHCIGGGVCSIAAKNIYLCNAGIGQCFLLSSLTKPNQLTLSTAARVLHTWTRLVYELKSKCLHVDPTCQEIELRVFTSGTDSLEVCVTSGPDTLGSNRYWTNPRKFTFSNFPRDRYFSLKLFHTP